LPESEHRLDYAEHGFRGLLAQRVERPACRRFQSMGHRLDRRRLFRRLRRRREALAQRKVVRLTAHRDYGYDAGLLAGFDVVGAEIAGVREQILDLAQFLGQRFDLLQHLFDLALSVGAWTTSVATPNRLRAAAAACAL